MNKFSPVKLLEALHKDLSFQSNDEVEEFRKQALLRSVLKKFSDSDPVQLRKLHSEAINSFVERNASMSPYFSIPNHRLDLAFAWSDTLRAVFHSGEFQSNVMTLDHCFNYGYAGPGASRGTKHTNFLDKMFNSPLTFTSTSLYIHYVSCLPERWLQAELLRDEVYSHREVNGSALSSVPKDSKKNRTICTEPSLNMFYQLGAKEVINKLLIKRLKIDVSKQPSINKILACSGSISGELATLDLKDASDSIHLDLVRQILPRDVFHVLNTIRSHAYECPEHPISMDNQNTFNMISSMGNGFTFSLMTLLLGTLLDVFLRSKGDCYTHCRDGVFGDDIILPSQYADEFALVLSDFGFTVNLSKSFITGPFRESCGGDFYNGHDVRGIYIKKVKNAAQVYSAFNRLHWWSVRHSIPLHNCLRYLKGLVDFLPVPLYSASYEGFRIPVAHVTSRKYDEWGGIKYRCLRPVKRSRRVGDRERNPFGALIAFLGGHVQNQRISLRSDISDDDDKVADLPAKVAKKSTSSWDWLPTPYFTCRELEESWVQLLS